MSSQKNNSLMLVSSYCHSQQTQNMCITFVERRSNVFDVGPALYKSYTHVLFLLGMKWVVLLAHVAPSPLHVPSCRHRLVVVPTRVNPRVQEKCTKEPYVYLSPCTWPLARLGGLGHRTAENNKNNNVVSSSHFFHIGLW